MIFITGNYEPLTYHNCIWTIFINVEEKKKKIQLKNNKRKQIRAHEQNKTKKTTTIPDDLHLALWMAKKSNFLIC